jgi:hydrogenase nickel incorporation protein HypA/HybF
MHELSIAQSVIDIAEAIAKEQNARHVHAIKVRLGEFTTIAREALEFAFEVARRGSVAENATLEIEIVPMVIQCVMCGRIAEAVRAICLLCPQCGLPVKIVSGEELEVEYIDLERESESVPWIA